MIKSIRYRIYPTEEQKHQINIFLGCNRFIWNWGINKIIQYYMLTNGKWISGYDLNKRLVWEKNNVEKMKWLKDDIYDSQAIKNELLKLRQSVSRIFKKLSKFPKYKDMTKEDIEEIKSKLYKRKKYGSYKNKLNKNQIEKNIIDIAKLRLTKTKITLDDSHIEKMKYCSISHTKTDRYYISIQYESLDKPKREVKSKDDIIGIDIGIKTFVTLSNGDKIDFPKDIFDKRFDKRLAHQERVLSRQTRGSRNYEKQCIKLNRLYERECNRRDDWMHRQTKYLTTTYSEIHIENHLFYQGGKDCSKEVRKKSLDMAFGEFFRQLKYKSNLYGSTIVRMDKYFPSSQLCSNCGFQYHKVKTDNLREWDCPQCGSHHDRDLNAAINIANHYPTTNVA